MIKNNRLYAFDPARGDKALVGQIIGNALILVKNKEHLFKKFDAYAIDERCFQDIKKDGITEIRVKRIDIEQRLKASIETWEKNGVVRDFGHGRQIFLSLKYMDSYEPQLDYPTELERSK